MKRRAHRASRQGIKRHTNSSKQARHEAPQAKKGSKRARAQKMRRKRPGTPAVMNPRQGCAQNDNLCNEEDRPKEQVDEDLTSENHQQKRPPEPAWRPW